MKYKQKTFFSVLFVLFFLNLSFRLYSAPLSFEAFRFLDKAEESFNRSDFTSALFYAEEAKRTHVETVEYYISELTFPKESKILKNSGDDLKEFYKILQEIHELDKIQILDTIFLKNSQDMFGNSISTLLGWLKERLVFPESDILTAKVLAVEGEYTLALQYYESAWNNKHLLDIPDLKFDIAYAMAEIAHAQADYAQQEKFLLLVVKDDMMYGPIHNEPGTLKAMKNTIINEPSVTKFFTLYRHSNFRSLKAYDALTQIYLKNGSFDKAFSVSSLASIIAVTRLSQAISDKDFLYTYSDLQTLFSLTNQFPNIIEMAEKEQIWNVFLRFASVLEHNLYILQAKSLLHILESSCPNPIIVQKANLLLNH